MVAIGNTNFQADIWNPSRFTAQRRSGRPDGCMNRRRYSSAKKAADGQTLSVALSSLSGYVPAGLRYMDKNEEGSQQYVVIWDRSDCLPDVTPTTRNTIH